mmetsp:Transcript_3212/g.9215  ORF Transcript_3212/g.9215 Transcript_3212/m.9215 type:complete len:301 (-) Transcript_3212:1906-2808(-)
MISPRLTSVLSTTASRHHLKLHLPPCTCTTSRRVLSSSFSSMYQSPPHGDIVNLLIMGPPGSGKGTYGNLLAKRLGADIISAGDILRIHVANGTETGLAIKECQRLGRLADDDLVAGAVKSHLIDKYGKESSTPINKVKGEHPTRRKVRFILDGFPRTVAQAEMMESVEFWPDHLAADIAISIDVPDQICIDKVLGRRICRECGGDYNVTDIHYDGYAMPPKMPNPHCPCNREKNWMKREDDKEEIISARILDFHNETKPIIQHYESVGEMLHFRPYRGVDDVEELELLVYNYFDSMDKV